MTIREATIDDAGELARLRWDFSPDEVGGDLQIYADFRKGFRRFVDAALASGRWTIWVIEVGGRLVANIYVERIDKVPRPGKFGNQFGYITNVYVEPEFRNQGIGGRLMNAVIDWARQERLEFLIVWPSAESIAFYERSGFVESAEAMELHL